MQLDMFTDLADQANIVHNGMPKHGSPQDRGSADKYYDRPYDPHWYPAETYKGDRIGAKDMTPAQIEEYRYGWENEENKKDWG